jgi:hypothetical protein
LLGGVFGLPKTLWRMGLFGELVMATEFVYGKTGGFPLIIPIKYRLLSISYMKMLQ